MILSFPARFVGEFPATGPDRFRWDDVPHVGDVAIIRGPRFSSQPADAAFLAIRCACGDVDEVGLAPYVQRNGASWTLPSRQPVHMEPSVISTVGDSKRCHYFVHNGRLEILADSNAVSSMNLWCCGAPTHKQPYPS